MQEGKRVDMIVIDDYAHEKAPKKSVSDEILELFGSPGYCGEMKNCSTVGLPMRHLNGMNALTLSKYTEKP